jgi:hypothetical protein
MSINWTDNIDLCRIGFFGACQKCGTNFEFTGTCEKFDEFMDSKNFTCPNGHKERSSPGLFLGSWR